MTSGRIHGGVGRGSSGDPKRRPGGRANVDRRAFPRRRCSESAQLRGQFDGFFAVCHDLSLGGASVQTDALIPTGAMLELSLDLGDLGSVTSLARVTRSRAGQLGIRFVILDAASRFAIAAYTFGSRPALAS